MPTTTVPQSEVQSEFNLLDMNIGDLENVVSNLVNRLSPVLPSSVIAGEGRTEVESKQVQRNSPVGITLNIQNARLASVLANLYGVCNDLHT